MRVVDIDEDSLEVVGQWPWPRDILGEMVERLAANGAVVVAFDVLFAERDRYSPSVLLERNAMEAIRLPDSIKKNLQDIDFDNIMADSFASMPVVLGTARRGGDDVTTQVGNVDVLEFGEGLIDALPPFGTSTPIVPVLQANAAGIGSINVNPLADASVVRTVPMIWNSGTGAIPGLALEALRIALQEDALILWGDDTTSGVIDAIGIGQIDIPTLADGQMWVRFRADHPDLYVSAADVLSKPVGDPELVEKLEGHIILVGTSAAGLFDIRTTALGETVPGVSVHAQIIEQVLLGQFLTRADWVRGAEIVAIIFLGLLVGHRMFRSGPALSFATGAACAVLILGASWIAYTGYNLLVDASFAMIGGFIAFVLVAGYQFIVSDRDKREMRRSFSRYVAPTVLDQIEKRGFALELGGEIRPATVMFCDIRDFTPISERYNAEELVSFLNGLFDRLSAEILKTQGTIDKFIGDNVMAFWNAPLPVEDHPARAIQAALGMRYALDRFNKNLDGPPVRVAIGISTGDVCVGNIGSADRFDYSVIGDNVNVAARLEAACRDVGCDILIADQTRSNPSNFALVDAGFLELKGVSFHVRAWMVVGDDEAAASSAFADFSAALNAWKMAIKAGATEAEIGACFSQCIAAANAYGPVLQDFVQRLDSRRADYCRIPSDKTSKSKSGPMDFDTQIA